MRRKNQISSVVDKSQEVSNSLQNHWISCVLFGVFGLLAVPNAFVEPSIYSILVALFVTLIFVQSIMGIVELQQFRRALKSNPRVYANKKIRQPILYTAIFWFLPK